MTDDYAHEDLTLHGKFTDDGEYFRLYVLLNGVPIWVLQTDVASQREAFDEARKAGDQQPDDTPQDTTDEAPASESEPSQPAA